MIKPNTFFELFLDNSIASLLISQLLLDIFATIKTPDMHLITSLVTVAIIVTISTQFSYILFCLCDIYEISTNFLSSIIKNLYFSVKGIRDQNITPVDFAYSPKLDKIYVTLGSANHVAVVNGSDYNIEKYILAGSRVWGAALTNNDEELIVTNGNSDDISIIDLIKQTAVSSIPVGKTPHTVRVMK